MPAAWKPDGEPNDDGRAKFGKHARRWLTSRIRQELTRYLNGTAPTRRYGILTITGDDVAALVPWFMEHPMRYVYWVARDEYSGIRFSNGSWRFHADAVKGDIVQGMSDLYDARARAADAGAIPTLDHWLRADIAGTLTFAGDKGGGDEMRLSDDERYTLVCAALHRQRRWPRPCAACGEMFRSPARRQRRCPTCLAAKRLTANTSERSPKHAAAGRPPRQQHSSEPQVIQNPSSTDEAVNQRLGAALEAQKLVTELLRKYRIENGQGSLPGGDAGA